MGGWVVERNPFFMPTSACFCALGHAGTTFIAGTVLYFYPDVSDGDLWSAWLYTVGSFGFLGVDCLEFVTFTADRWLRANIALSATGSLCYVIGSVGFFPRIYAATDRVGVWGFILGR